MKRTTTAVLLGAGMTLALAAGCGGDEEQAPTGECEESGISQACACAEGGTGVQLCLDDLSWGECQNCPAPTVDAGDTTPDTPIVDGCLSDDECGAYQCVGLSQSEPGECGTSCRIDRECNDGYECEAGVCIEAEPAGCTEDSECGGYRCDTEAGLCFTSCTDGSECNEGFECDAASSSCSPPPSLPLTLVAVLSEVPEDDAAVTDTPYPGPDIDTIEIFTGSVLFTAEASGGTPGAAPTNNANDPAAAVGPRDSVPETDGEDCAVDSGFFSLGAAGGFVLAQFPNDVSGIGNNAEIYIIEMGKDDCPNVDDAFNDAYSVWIGEATDPLPGQAAQIRQQWCQVGTAPNGGSQTFVVNLDNCD